MGGVAMAVLMLAQVASAPADPPAPAVVSTPVKQAEDTCALSRESAEKGEIIVCAPRPQSYRLNPDVMVAKKAMRGGGKPNPPERFRDTSCMVVGPMGCGNGGVNLLAAAMTAARMADKLSNGENIGTMFITDPHPSEYQLYQQAKREREAKEEEARTQEAVKAARALAKR